jgi:acyl carrier protein
MPSTVTPPNPRNQLQDWVLEAVRRTLPDMNAHRHVNGDLALDARLEEDLGLDSLSRMELIAQLEKEFGMRFQTAHLQQISTVRDLADVISKSTRE